MRVVAAAADEFVLDRRVEAAIVIVPLDHALDFAHDFRADAVAGDDEDVSCHWSLGLSLFVIAGFDD